MTRRPPDIDPESGCRLTLPRREALDEAGRRIYDSLVDPKGGSLAGLNGPGGIRLHSPETAVLTSALNRHLRTAAGLSSRVRELAILVTARAHDCRFEWAAHEGAALKAGVPLAAIDAVKHESGLEGLAEEDALLIRLGRELFGRRRVAPETFARALARFGPRGLVDLVSLMGLYAATAALLIAFDAQLRPDETALLPVDSPDAG